MTLLFISGNYFSIIYIQSNIYLFYIPSTLLYRTGPPDVIFFQVNYSFFYVVKFWWTCWLFLILFENFNNIKFPKLFLNVWLPYFNYSSVLLFCCIQQYLLCYLWLIWVGPPQFQMTETLFQTRKWEDIHWLLIVQLWPMDRFNTSWLPEGYKILFVCDWFIYLLLIPWDRLNTM